MPTVTGEGVLRLKNVARKVGGMRVRTPWRKRKPVPKLSLEEKANKKKARIEKKNKFNEALFEARAEVWDIAERMRALFPQHTLDYFYRLLTHQPKVTQKQRAISQWQAFLSLELEKHNGGT